LEEFCSGQALEGIDEASSGDSSKLRNGVAMKNGTFSEPLMGEYTY